LVKEAPKQQKVTTNSKTAKHKKLQPKPEAAPKATTTKTKKEAAASVKSVANKPNPAKLVEPTHPATSTQRNLFSITLPSPHVWNYLVGYSSLPTG
jgi:hypothetical protein